MTFGDRFKQLRLEKGLTQQDLAEDFNKIYGYTFSKPSISQYENGKRSPENKPLRDFATYFNVSVDYLLGTSNIRNLDNFLDTHILSSIEKLFCNEDIPREEKDLFFKNVFELYFRHVPEIHKK